MSLSLTKVFRGVVTVAFINTTGPTTHLSYSGLKADVATLTLEQKEATIELEDGQEIKNNEGWTGTFELKLSQLDATDIATLQTYKPGATTGVNKILVTFTDLGSGSNYTIAILGVTSLVLGAETGSTWKCIIKYGITAAASAVLTDILDIDHA